ncbi:MAG: hypothetical protein IH596_05255 [Bacteroidales bacterium]|nr:hypothetical protein [Bacteroidales bacterium]
MDLSKILRLIWNEIHDFIIWFAHSKPAIIVALFLTLLLPAYVFYLAVVSPASSCDHDFPTADTTEMALVGLDVDSSQMILQKVDTIWDLELDKAYLSNMLLLSFQDSAYLNLNLPDSLLHMEIKGVPVRECRLTDIRVTKRLRCLNKSQLLQWISTPFLGRADHSTIPKIRYVVKEAPKDTSEAALQNAGPLPADSSSVFFIVYFNRHLAIEVRQREEPYDYEEEVLGSYEKEIQGAVRSKTMQAVLAGLSPEPEILIRLEVSKADARAIYRGLPAYPGLALKLQ